MQRGQTAPVGALALLVTLTLGAVIGDVPYGDAAQQHFPAFIDGIDADPDVRMVTHLGAVKNGSTTCDDQRLQAVRRDFDRFTDPLVHTPGDNEWTDCHRADNGAYQPLERLDEVRRLYLDRPGTTLGRRVRVTSLADLRAGGRGADPDGGQPAQPAGGVPDRAAAPPARGGRAAAGRHVRPHRHRPVDRGLLRLPAPDQALVHESRRFHGAVYLFNGDSHWFNVDQPLAAGSHWLSFYGVRGSAGNLRRVTVDGSDLGEADWLKVTVQPRGRELLTFEQVPGA
jgi:hypothetical protein